MTLSISPITKKVADEVVTKKHYSRRASIFWKGYGLYESYKLVGVAVYGQPSPPIQKYAFADRDFRLYELARVVIWTSTKNAASFLVGQSLRALHRDTGEKCAVVSYADSEQGHAGIIYQATNWLYTGGTKSHDKAYIVDGVRTHPMTLRDRGITDPTRWARANGIEMVPAQVKHRYFMLLGSKFEKKDMRRRLKYPIVTPYPKCEQRRYDDGPEVSIYGGHPLL